MNVPQLDTDLFEFTIHNIHCVERPGGDDFEVVLSGHYSVVWNRKTDLFVLRQIGRSDSLTNYTPVHGWYRRPTRVEEKHLRPILEKEIVNTCFRRPEGAPSHAHGDRLVPSDYRIIHPNVVWSNREWEDKILADIRKINLITHNTEGLEWDTSNKMCFMYCGDDLCNCNSSPYYPGNSKSILGMTAKAPKRKTKKPKLR
jgi:hypothetical protein